LLNTLAKMLGLSAEHAEASMHSERAARAVLTRRNLFAAGAALAAGSAFSFGSCAGFWAQNPAPLSWKDILMTFDGVTWRLGGLSMRVTEVVGTKVTRKVAGPAGCDITVSGEETNDEIGSTEVDIVFPPILRRARR
jgi:hypothetical protein